MTKKKKSKIKKKIFKKRLFYCNNNIKSTHTHTVYTVKNNKFIDVC